MADLCRCRPVGNQDNSLAESAKQKTARRYASDKRSPQCSTQNFSQQLSPGPVNNSGLFYPFAVEVRLVLQIFFTYF
jgi:hypothetical protein